MRALLLAAGFGTRLKPITNSTPKCLIQINDRPLLDYWLDLLLKNSLIEKVLINTHYLHEIVNEHILRSPYYKNIDIIYEEKLLGTAGTLLNNCKYFEDKAFFVAHADNLTRFNLKDFIKFHNKRKKGVLITMMTFYSPTPESCGVVEINSDGIVINFHEKIKNPPGNIANGAVYIFEYEVIEYMKSLNKKVLDISIDVIPIFLGKIQSYLNNNYHRDIGTIDSLLLAEQEFKEKF